ncbi:hypothetical protein GCM10023205_82270 [Yinghuangia aomiensis]|uniref:DUF3349 domain-containing protein n=1 Tax=Yinghuangia aomiensis TaxID=676205 RepID=A0ABP9IGG7_9ACTN
MSVPPYLERTLSILRTAYPEGLPTSDYLPVVRVLTEGMSLRNLNDVVAELTGYATMKVYNDVGFAAELELTDPDVVRVEARLTRHGWDPDDDE